MDPRPWQTLATRGATRSAAFAAHGRQYLVIANSRNTTSYHVPSEVWRWQAGARQFERVQQLATVGAADVAAFAMGDGHTYVAVANQHDTGGVAQMSVIYRVNATSGLLDEWQVLPTSAATGWEPFTIDGTAYLALASLHSGASHVAESAILRYDADVDEFVPFQTVPTQGAEDWAAFTVDGTPYLAVANQFDDTTSYVPSQVWRWDSEAGQFALLQNLTTVGAVQVAAFAAHGHQFLAVANHFDRARDRFMINSTVFIFDAAAGRFEPHQHVPTLGAHGVTAFSLFGDDHFLVFANTNSGSPTSPPSHVYRLDAATLRFTLIEQLPTVGAYDATLVVVDDTPLLAVTSHTDLGAPSDLQYHTTSQLFRLNAFCA